MTERKSHTVDLQIFMSRLADAVISLPSIRGREITASVSLFCASHFLALSLYLLISTQIRKGSERRFQFREEPTYELLT